MDKWSDEGLIFQELDSDGLARAAHVAGDAFLIDESASDFLVEDIEVWRVIQFRWPTCVLPSSDPSAQHWVGKA